MKLNQIVTVAAIVCLLVTVSNTKAIPAANTINLGQSANTLEHYNTFIQSEKQTLQISKSNLINSKFEIKPRSMIENWINLLGKLIILVSFSYCGATRNSVVIERYIKFIFKDILPIFIIVYLLINLLGIVSLIAAN